MWKLLRDLVVGCLPLRQARLSEPERDTNVNKSHRHTATRRPTEGDIIAQAKRSCPALLRSLELQRLPAREQAKVRGRHHHVPLRHYLALTGRMVAVMAEPMEGNHLFIT